MLNIYIFRPRIAKLKISTQQYLLSAYFMDNFALA